MRRHALRSSVSSPSVTLWHAPSPRITSRLPSTTGPAKPGIFASPSRSSRTTVRHFETSSPKVFSGHSACKSLLTTGLTGHPRFFLGSDSAPHPPHTKSSSTPQQACAAGVYTSPILLPLCAQLLESFGALDRLQNFVGGFGRQFYRRPAPSNATVKLQRTKGHVVPEEYALGEEKVVSFWAGKALDWKLV
jgi:hypothetical protein